MQAPSRRLCLLLACLLWTHLASAAQAPVAQAPAAIASSHPLATEAGFEVLNAGGNAFDAAVAVSAVLSVVEPYSTGLGGGGFWLLHRAKDSFQIMIDGRETAPLAATRDMYLNNRQQLIPGASIDGPGAAAIPGLPAGLAHLSTQYGKLKLADALAPAIRIATAGFPVSKYYRRMARFRLAALDRFPAARHILLNDGELPTVGSLIKQPDLARTLQAIAKHGRDGFYTGKVAQKLVEGVRDAGGNWSLADLLDYKTVERKPVSFSYQGMTITSAALPSSGGIVLAQILNVLAGFDLAGSDPVTRNHLIIEAMRRAYRDRATWLGDSDFVDVPVQRLISAAYAATLTSSISTERATISQSLTGIGLRDEGRDTTHFSVLDKDGNRVAATLTINYPFGSGFVAPGTGVLLNDEMDDFSARPGTPNAYGLVGGNANAIAPGKRPLSSMSPTFIDSSRGFGILGTPGGSRIITMVLLGILDYAAGNGPESWVSLPRFHHQYLPDDVQIEPNGMDEKLLAGLENRGHMLKRLSRTYGNMQAIFKDAKTGKVEAASDPRREGLAVVR